MDPLSYRTNITKINKEIPSALYLSFVFPKVIKGGTLCTLFLEEPEGLRNPYRHNSSQVQFLLEPYLMCGKGYIQNSGNFVLFFFHFSIKKNIILMFFFEYKDFYLSIHNW